MRYSGSRRKPCVGDDIHRAAQASLPSMMATTLAADTLDCSDQ